MNSAGKILARLVHVVTAVVFISAAISKILEPHLIVQTIRFWLSDILFARFISVVVIACDLFLGVMLLWGSWKNITIKLTVAVLLVYTCHLAVILIADSPLGCGCGGVLEMFNNAKHNAIWGVFRNLALSASLVWSLRFEKEQIPPSVLSAV